MMTIACVCADTSSLALFAISIERALLCNRTLVHAALLVANQISVSTAGITQASVLHQCWIVMATWWGYHQTSALVSGRAHGDYMGSNPSTGCYCRCTVFICEAEQSTTECILCCTGSVGPLGGIETTVSKIGSYRVDGRVAVLNRLSARATAPHLQALVGQCLANSIPTVCLPV